MKKILLIEDNEFISTIYREGLTGAGFKVFHIKDGQNAIQTIRKTKPDVILLDLIMPNRDGFEVLEDIEQNPDLKSIPVIILTNLEDSFYTTDISKYKVAGKLLKSGNYLRDIIVYINSVLQKKQGDL